MSNLPREKKLGIPNILSLRTEPLNSPFTLKLWPSVHRYISEGPGPDFVREAIKEKLQRLLDRPRPAVCRKCLNLNTSKGEDPFCLVLCAYLDWKLLDQKFTCDYFQLKKEEAK